MMDLRLLTSFSSETRHPGLDQYLSDTSNVRAPPAHPRQRTDKGADGVEVQSFTLSGRCQIMLKESTVLPSRTS